MGVGDGSAEFSNLSSLALGSGQALWSVYSVCDPGGEGLVTLSKWTSLYSLDY